MSNPIATIFESGRKYRLHNPTMTNADIASYLTGRTFSFFKEGNEVNQPLGTFWVSEDGGAWGRLVAIRTSGVEITVLRPFHDTVGFLMLAIADFLPEGP